MRIEKEMENEEVDWRVVREYIVKEVGDWDDDVVWRCRFKDFSGQRSDWNPLFLFWRDLILTICLRFQILFLRFEFLNKCFNRGGLNPLCLSHVLLLMHDDGLLLRSHQLHLLDPRTGRLSLIFTKLTNLLGRMFTSTSTSTSTSDNLYDNNNSDDDVYIVMPVLKDKAAQLLKVLSEDTSSIVTFSRFHRLCDESSHSQSSASAILSYLSSQSQARFLSLNSPHLNIQGVKVSLSASPVSSVSSLDYDVLHLIWTTETLDQQLAVIDKRCQRSKKSALDSLASGNKNVALRHVRALKLANESREKCAALLNRVEEVLHVITNAESTKKISEALQIGAQAIKKNKISVKEVEHSLQELKESIDLQKQVENALESTSSHTFVDEEDIEEEFKKLELEIESGNNAQPSIPEGKAHTATEKIEALDSADSLSEAFSNLKVVDGLSSTAAGRDIAAKKTKNLELEAA